MRDKCYNCKRNENTFYFTENGFDLHQCDYCKLIFVINPPDISSILQSHEQGMHRGKRETLYANSRFQEGKKNYLISILNDMFDKDEIDGKKWLDIGSGNGEFISALNTFSMNKVKVIGSEPNRKKREEANKRLLLTKYIDIDECKDKFDFISILNVYAHIYDPPEFISKLKKLLLPGGEIFIETSDTVNFSPEKHYKPFYLPDHLSFPSEAILKNIFDKSGFSLVSIKRTPFVKGGVIKFIKEFIKFLLPNYKSKLIYLVRFRKTDLFLRFKIN